MSKYSYVVIDEFNKKIRGTINSPSKEKAVLSLNSNNFVVIDIKKEIAPDLSRVFNYSEKKIDTDLLVTFLVQLDSLLTAGINIVQASDIIVDSFVNDRSFHKVLKVVFDKVKTGEKLSEALKIYDNFFPSILISSVAAAEKTGKLNDVISQLATYYDKRSNLKKQIKGVLTYPIFMFVFSILALAFLLYFVVPSFVSLYETQNSEIPGITQLIINFSDFLVNNIFIIILFIIGIIFLIYYLNKKKEVRYFFSRLMINIPIVGEYIVLTNLIKISSNIGLMFDTTKNKLEVLELAKNQMQNEVYKEVMSVMYINAFSGKPLLNELKDDEILPLFFKQMFEIGENTGQISDLMKKTTRYYETRLDNGIVKLKSMIEPLSILLIVILLLPVIIGIVLPMFTIYEQF
ncbi:MAG: type II secretion system F family protein [Bacilli bacterium]